MSGSRSSVTTLRVDPEILNKPKTDENGSCELHFVPAAVEEGADGRKTEVGAYFSRMAAEDAERGCMVAAFRGRPLDGERVSAPEGHRVAVVKSGRGGAGLGAEGGTKEARVTAAGEAFVAWNYDKVPTERDALRMAIQHVRLAQVLHGDD